VIIITDLGSVRTPRSYRREAIRINSRFNNCDATLVINL